MEGTRLPALGSGLFIATFLVRDSDADKKKVKMFPYSLAYCMHALVSKTVNHKAPPSFTYSSFLHFVYMKHFICTYRHSENARGPPVTVINTTKFFPPCYTLQLMLSPV